MSHKIIVARIASVQSIVGAERIQAATVPFLIIDDGGESLIINSVEHANNLKKALDKAIELGWVV